MELLSIVDPMEILIRIDIENLIKLYCTSKIFKSALDNPLSLKLLDRFGINDHRTFVSFIEAYDMYNLTARSHNHCGPDLLLRLACEKGDITLAKDILSYIDEISGTHIYFAAKSGNEDLIFLLSESFPQSNNNVICRRKTKINSIDEF